MTYKNLGNIPQLREAELAVMGAAGISNPECLRPMRRHKTSEHFGFPCPVPLHLLLLARERKLICVTTLCH